MAISYEHTITIDRAAHEVFAFFSDPKNATTWQSGLVKVAADGPLKQGSKWREIRRFLGRDIETALEVTEYEPDRRFAARGSGGSARFAFEWQVTPSANGTDFTFRGQADPGRLLRIGGRFMARAAKRQIQADLARAKQILEARR
ncbi:MAG: SRPBCC family protein [Candidatus Limnocylindria bacterium]